MQRLRTRLRSGASTGFAPPSLTLDFLSGSLDSRVTFTRGSNATLVDSTGKVTYAPNNLLPYSQEFDNAGWTKGNSTVTANSVTAPDGTLTADTLTENTSNAFHAATRSVTLAGTLTLSCYLKAGTRNFAAVRTYDGTNGDRYAVFNLSTGTAGAVSGNTTAAITAVGGGWYRCSMTYTFTSASGSAGVTIQDANSYVPYTGNGTGDIYIWGAQLEQVTYQTTPSTYNATTTSAYYGPRFDYDPVTLAAKGLLIEEQRTNLLIYSEQFNNANWTATGATVTANSVSSPGGTLDADSLVEDTSTGTHRVYATPSCSASTTYTYTVYVKSAGRTQVRLIETTLLGAFFDLSAVSVIATDAGVTASIQDAGNGWRRCRITATTGGAQTLFVTQIQAGSAGTVTYTGNGTTALYIYGAQLEAGAFATSYIPTVASTVTRSADVAQMTGTNFSSWYNQSEGTLIAQASTVGTTGSRGVAGLLANGLSTNSICIYTSGATTGYGDIISGGVVQASFSPSITTQPIKAALSYAQNNTNFALNGAVQTDDTSCTIPTGINQLTIGAIYSASTYTLNGHIRAIAYYPQRLPNYQLQGLTA